MRNGLIILADLLDQDLIWLAGTGRVRRLEPGEVLIEAGRELNDLFIVTDGRLTVTAGGDVIAEPGIGDVLGEMSFVQKHPPVATVTARTVVRVLAVPRRALLDEFRVDSGFAARFYRALAVFLSDRLRAMSPYAGQDEVDEAVLDQLHVAGDRMLRLIDLLEGSEAAH